MDLFLESPRYGCPTRGKFNGQSSNGQGSSFALALFAKRLYFFSCLFGCFMDSLSRTQRKSFLGAEASLSQDNNGYAYSDSHHSGQANDLAELKGVLQQDLTPNKRAIVETLISSWEAKQSAERSDRFESSISVEKKKNRMSQVSGGYPSWDVAVGM